MNGRALIWRRRAAAAAMALYVASAVAAPMVHAEREVLRARSAVESHHSAHCPVIHSDATCPSVGHFQLMRPITRVLASGPVPALAAPATPSEERLGQAVPLLLRGRAPPTA